MTDKSNSYLTEDRSLKFLDRTLWIRLGIMLKGYKWMVVLAFVFLLGAELLPQFQPKLVKAIIDGPIFHSLNPDSPSPSYSVPQYILAFFILIFFTGIFKYFAGVISQSIALNIIHRFRTDLFKRVQGYKTDFFKRTPVGRLMTRLTNDIDLLNSMFAEGFIDLAGAFLMLIFPVVFMLLEDWKLALITLTMAPFMLLITSIFRIKVREINKVIKKLLAEINTNMQENLSGSYIVQMFGKERNQWKEFDERNGKLKNAWLKNVKYYSYYFPFIHGLTEISIVALYFAGGYWFFKDQVSLGTLMEFSMYMGMFWRPLREISDKYTQLQTSLASAERVFTLYDLNPIMEKGNISKIESPFVFSFENVTFGYEESQTVLKDVSFEVMEGETVAIVGATGSGKSTILSLCNDFYRPRTGQIKFNDTALKNFEGTALHNHISFIPQEVYLYADTILFNISLSTNPDVKRVEEVSKYVNAHSFIQNMDKGYESKLTLRGENLSTGQRQLLAFARALYHQPKLLLLDEATSSIDTESEELIQDALKKLTKKMTTIVVAHRLSTVRNADKIIVMHKGEIREVGKHSELLGQKGIYHKLYQLQESNH